MSVSEVADFPAASSAEKYSMLDLVSHVRLRPEMYVGAVAPEAQLRWVVGTVTQISALSLEQPITSLADKDIKRLRKQQRVLVVGGATDACSPASALSCTGDDAGSVASTGSKPASNVLPAAAYLLLETSPAAETIVKEILQNALDRQHKDEAMRRITVTVDEVAGVIEIMNDGAGMPVTKPERTSPDVPDEYWISILFTRSMSGENFAQGAAGHYQAGRNGIGGKAANIMSKMFRVEVGDPSTRKLFVQQWTDGMAATTGPKVKAYARKTGYVKITFQPDMEYFK